MLTTGLSRIIVLTTGFFKDNHALRRLNRKTLAICTRNPQIAFQLFVDMCPNRKSHDFGSMLRIEHPNRWLLFFSARAGCAKSWRWKRLQGVEGCDIVLLLGYLYNSVWSFGYLYCFTTIL